MTRDAAAEWLAANAVDPRAIAEKHARRHRLALGDVDADQIVDLAVDAYGRARGVDSPESWIAKIVDRRAAGVLRSRARAVKSRKGAYRPTNRAELIAACLLIEIPESAPWLAGVPCGVGRSDEGNPNQTRTLVKARKLLAPWPELVAAVDERIEDESISIVVGADDSLRDCILRARPLASALRRPLTPSELARAVVWFGYVPPRCTDERVRQRRPTPKQFLQDVARDVRQHLQSAAARQALDPQNDSLMKDDSQGNDPDV